MEGAGWGSVSSNASECDSDSAMTSRTESCFKLLKVCTARRMRVSKLSRFLYVIELQAGAIPECPSDGGSV